MCLGREREGGLGRRCADHFLYSAFSSFLLLQLGLFVGYLSVMQCADGHCCMCQSHLVWAASFPDLTPHPSPFLRSRHPTRSALPTADSEVTTGKAVTAIAVWLFASQKTPRLITSELQRHIGFEEGGTLRSLPFLFLQYSEIWDKWSLAVL